MLAQGDCIGKIELGPQVGRITLRQQGNKESRPSSWQDTTKEIGNQPRRFIMVEENQDLQRALTAASCPVSLTSMSAM